jgi:ribonucleoside-diphosphate reductase subunit M1
MMDLYNYINPKNKKHSPMVSKELLDIVTENADRLNSAIIYDRDYNYNYFGFKVNGAIVSVTIPI